MAISQWFDGLEDLTWGVISAYLQRGINLIGPKFDTTIGSTEVGGDWRKVLRTKWSRPNGTSTQKKESPAEQTQTCAGVIWSIPLKIAAMEFLLGA